MVAPTVICYRIT